ncbi:MAG: DNA recombination protein RmuC [Elusimicrobiaceae bacterium]|nr:DNA recombination protein RmuC [Elusimicrobiaceae bacterium]
MEIYILILAFVIIAVFVYEFVSKTKTIKELNEKNKDLELKSQELYTQINNLEKEKAKIDAENKLQKQTQEQQKIIFDNMQKVAEGKFKEIATELLTQKTKELKDNGNEIVLNKINPLINPLNQHLNYLQDKLASMEHLNQNLQKEASALTLALTNQKKQGDFGEMLLEQLLESCGLKEGVHFQKQPNFINEEGENKRPDFVVNMPGGRYMVIDSKMSLTAYSAYVNATDSIEKEKYLQEHIESVKKHIKELSEKRYQELKAIYKRTPDFVIMYVPLESAYLCALEKQKDLGIFASGKKVAVATASSLIPILKTIESLWAINITQKNIEEVILTGKKLHSQAVEFVNEMGTLEDNFTTVKNTFERAKKKISGQKGIIHYTKKLEELGAKSNKQLPLESEEIL